MSDDARRAEAADSVAERFTRIMRASTSPYGVLTDPPAVGAAIALLVVPTIVLLQLDVLPDAATPLAYLAAAIPIAVAVGMNLALSKARGRVIDWLASLPFAFENMNGLLNGVGQHLLLRFADEPASRDELNALLDAVHPDCFALELHASEPEIELKIGVPDSKLNPAGAHYRRYRRVQAMVEQALVPLHQTHPIAWVRVT